MATDIPMPKLGLTMEEAMIVEWLVPDGAHVEADMPIMVIETDKTETEVGAIGSGRLHHIGKAGEVYACGVRIGLLLAEGEDPPTALAPGDPASSASSAPSAAPSTPSAPSAAPAPAPTAVAPTAPVATMVDGRILASPNARRIAAERGVTLSAVRGTGPGGRIVSEDVEAAAAAGVCIPVGPQTAAVEAGAAPVATAAAGQLADLLGIDLSDVAIDPVEQRITRDSVAAHVRNLLSRLPGRSPLPPPPPSGGATPVPAAPTALLLQEPVRTIRLSGMRGTIAKRMTASLREMAQLTLTMDAGMDAVLADRAERKQAGGTAPSVTDYVVAAAARALLRHPDMNAQVTADGIAVLPDIHVGLAVAVDGGLLVPVVRDAAHRELPDLAAETTRLADAARQGALGPADLEGGTFSVSALGMFGVDAFTPVINPPNAGILGVGRLRDDLVLADGVITTVKRFTLSLTWDHRVLDGVPAAEFCRTIVELLADPALLA